MLKNRELRIKLSKAPKNEDSPDEDKVLHPDSAKLLEETGKRVVKYVALTVVAVIVAVKAADTLSQIAVKKTKSADE